MLKKMHRRKNKAAAFSTCTYCPKLCTHSCFVSTQSANESLAPQAKISTLDRIESNLDSFSNEHLDSIYGCSGCLRCTTFCKQKIPVGDELFHARAQANEQNIYHPQLKELKRTVLEQTKKIVKAIEKSELSTFISKSAQTAFYPALDPFAFDIKNMKDIFSIFHALDLGFIRISPIKNDISIYTLWSAGLKREALEAGKELINTLSRFPKVITASTHAAYMLREVLPKLGLDHKIDVHHISEYLATHSDRLPIKRRKSHVIYHDPCYLGRGLNVYQAPRQLITKCVEHLHEFYHSHQDAKCCGGGGVFPLTSPKIATAQIEERIEETKRRNIPTIISACPQCKTQLSLNQDQIEVLDLVNLVAWAIREDEKTSYFPE